MSDHKQSVIMYYDGECRMCQRYARYAGLFEQYDMQLRNARDYPDAMQEYAQQWYDINQGMIVIYQDQVYHGVHAIIKIDYLVRDMTDEPTIHRWHRLTYCYLNRRRKIILRMQWSSIEIWKSK